MSLTEELHTILSWPTDVINIVSGYTSTVIKHTKCAYDFTIYTYDKTIYYLIDNILRNDKTKDIYVGMNFCLCTIQNIDYMLFTDINMLYRIFVVELPLHNSIRIIDFDKSSTIHQIINYANILVIQFHDCVKIYKINSIFDIRCIKSIQKNFSLQQCRLLCMNAKFIFMQLEDGVKIYDYDFNLIKTVPIASHDSCDKYYNL